MNTIYEAAVKTIKSNNRNPEDVIYAVFGDSYVDKTTLIEYGNLSDADIVVRKYICPDLIVGKDFVLNYNYILPCGFTEDTSTMWSFFPNTTDNLNFKTLTDIIK